MLNKSKSDTQCKARQISIIVLSQRNSLYR